MHRSLVGLVVLSFFALVAPSGAREVTLWACHGPTGGALGAAPINASGTVSGNCDAPGTALRAGTLQFNTPASTTLTHVALDRRAAGPGYLAKAAADLERLDDASTLDGKADWAASGPGVTLSGGTIDVRSIALTVDDATAPTAAIGGIRNPASGTLMLDVKAVDGGLGLARTVASIDGAVAASKDFGVCAELSPQDATVDRALGADCPAVAEQMLAVNTTGYPDGKHILRVAIIDAAGNQAALPEFELSFINAQPTAQPTATIEIGNGTPTPTATPTPSPSPSPSPEPAPIVSAATPTPTPLPITPARKYTIRDFLSIPARPKVSKGVLTLTARCPLTSTCTIRVSIKRGGKSLSTGTVALKPGATKQLKLKLTKAAQRTLKRRKSLDVRLTVAGYPGVVIVLR